jgi:hypothetical protein
MLEQVKQLAMEKFTGDAAQADAFVNSFVKEAMATKGPAGPTGRPYGSPYTNPAAVIHGSPTGGGSKLNKDSLKGSMLMGLGGELGKGLGGLLISGGVAGIGAAARMINNDSLHTKFLSALERAISSNRILRESNKEKVHQYAETVFRFAPNVSTDTNILTSVLTNAIHGESMDPATLKMLVELEGRVSDNNSFSPKTYI